MLDKKIRAHKMFKNSSYIKGECFLDVAKTFYDSRKDILIQRSEGYNATSFRSYIH